MTAEQIARRLKASDLAATDQRAALLQELTALYVRRKVLTRGGGACRLDRCCEAEAGCWRNTAADAHPGRTAAAAREPDGSIFWPWIGEQYLPVACA